MRKAVIPVLLALSLAALPLSAQENKKKKAIDLEQEFFQLPDSVTNEWLDATSLPKKARINDYWIVGVHGGVSLQYGYYNPPRQTRFYPNLPAGLGRFHHPLRDDDEHVPEPGHGSGLPAQLRGL